MTDSPSPVPAEEPPVSPHGTRRGKASTTSVVRMSGKTTIHHFGLRQNDGEDPTERAIRKVKDTVAVIEFLCFHKPDAEKTPLLLDRLSYNIEMCLSDGLKSRLGGFFGRSPLHAMLEESYNVVPVAQRELMERMLKLANKIGTTNIGRSRVFIRLLFNNKVVASWLAALLKAPLFLEFVFVLLLFCVVL